MAMCSSVWKRILLLPIAIIFFSAYCFSEKAPYSFVKDATTADQSEYYDYIIIGGGTSGCALAATLSSGGAKVLLLERGGLPYGNPKITSMDGFIATLLDISPTSASQPFISTDGVFNHRARVLGGGTALNAGFYSRASNDYVKRVGWDQRLVNESYDWVEKKLVFKPTMSPWQSAVRDGLLEAGVLPDNGFTYEHLIGTKFGGTIFDQNGYRHTAADLLEYADPTKITVYLYATVHRILFNRKGLQKPRAYGVVYRDSKRGRHSAYLNTNNPRNEIILSAGALGSPQLLMLSGIGPTNHLMALNISVLLNQPMVGQGMSDNPLNCIYVPSPRHVEVSLVQAVGITRFGNFIEALSGDQVRMFLSIPDNISIIQSMHGFEAYKNSIITQGGIIGEKIERPLSTGHLELKNTDPNSNPRVTFNYFSDPRDFKKCVQGMETVLKVIQSRSFSKFRNPFIPVQILIKLMRFLPLNLRTRHLTGSFSLEQYCNDTVMTIWHYHGGCQVHRVLDHDYRLVGVDALRVVDGSTFYDSPGTNPQATVMMLGRYMGQKILRERTTS